MSMIPLIISIAITIHKSQGMTIGPNEMYGKLIHHFHKEIKRKHQVVNQLDFPV